MILTSWSLLSRVGRQISKGATTSMPGASVVHVFMCLVFGRLFPSCLPND